MNRMAFDLNIDTEDLYPANYFDLMGGVGFGGYVPGSATVLNPLTIYRLAAVMLWMLRMSVD